MKVLPKFTQFKQDTIIFGGGLDIDTPPLQIPSDYCRAALNYECAINGGYRTLTGYERFNGRPKPSDALYAILNATISGTFNLGDILVGAVSGATGIIIGWTDAYFVLTGLIGSFQDNEDLFIL